jgi:hypothetical protein
LIKDKLSLNKKYAANITNTVLHAIKAPTIPPFMPAERVELKAIVAA